MGLIFKMNKKDGFGAFMIVILITLGVIIFALGLSWVFNHINQQEQFVIYQNVCHNERGDYTGEACYGNINQTCLTNDKYNGWIAYGTDPYGNTNINCAYQTLPDDVLDSCVDSNPKECQLFGFSRYTLVKNLSYTYSIQNCSPIYTTEQICENQEVDQIPKDVRCDLNIAENTTNCYTKNISKLNLTRQWLNENSKCIDFVKNNYCTDEDYNIRGCPKYCNKWSFENYIIEVKK